MARPVYLSVTLAVIVAGCSRPPTTGDAPAATPTATPAPPAEPPPAANTPAELLPNADGRSFICFLFFELEAQLNV